MKEELIGCEHKNNVGCVGGIYCSDCKKYICQHYNIIEVSSWSHRGTVYTPTCKNCGEEVGSMHQ